MNCLKKRFFFLILFLYHNIGVLRMIMEDYWTFGTHCSIGI